MIIEKSLMKTEAKFSDDRVYRYVLSKEWNNKHLKCNLREIEKMKSINIFDWLFVK